MLKCFIASRFFRKTIEILPAGIKFSKKKLIPEEKGNDLHGLTLVYVCLLERESNKPAACTMVTVFPIWRVRFEIKSFPFCCSSCNWTCFIYLPGFRELDIDEDLAVGRYLFLTCASH